MNFFIDHHLDDYLRDTLGEVQSEHRKMFHRDDTAESTDPDPPPDGHKQVNKDIWCCQKLSRNPIRMRMQFPSIKSSTIFRFWINLTAGREHIVPNGIVSIYENKIYTLLRAVNFIGGTNDGGMQRNYFAGRDLYDMSWNIVCAVFVTWTGGRTPIGRIRAIWFNGREPKWAYCVRIQRRWQRYWN